MLKKALAAALLLTPLLANAYTWDQTIDFNPDPRLNGISGYTFTHDLKTDGFNPGIDSISSYALTINLYNGKGMLDAVYIDQPGLSGDSSAILYNWTYASLSTGDSYQGLASLNSNGLLNVSVYGLGTFYLDKSSLVANGKQGTGSTAVPEPTSIALLAAGLLGIAVMRRTSKAA
jgi:hypothetical protein